MFPFIPIENSAELVQSAELIVALEKSGFGCHAAAMCLEPIAKACWEVVEAEDDRTELLEDGVVLAFDPSVRVRVIDPYWALEYSKLILEITRAGEFMIDLEIALADDHDRSGGGDVDFEFRTPLIALEVSDLPSFERFLLTAKLLGGVFDWEAKSEPVSAAIAPLGKSAESG